MDLHRSCFVLLGIYWNTFFCPYEDNSAGCFSDYCPDYTIHTSCSFIPNCLCSSGTCLQNKDFLSPTTANNVNRTLPSAHIILEKWNIYDVHNITFTMCIEAVLYYSNTFFICQTLTVIYII